ncbi:ABC transporter ATP-binding protein [Saprospiraceae bacterium]|nr:ABC transporter ATP-binding protein [Saprospiraceae bacterium]
MKSILEIENLQLSLGAPPNDSCILRDVSFNLYKGEVLGLVGSSGSGKSMTLRSIIRLLEAYPIYQQSGKILYTDKNAQSLDIVAADADELIKFRRTQVGVVFQQSTQVLNPSIKVGDQIKERIDLLGINEAAGNKTQVLKLLEEVHLTPTLNIYDRYPHELSGGQIQRILIAMALANSPQLLLADEPTFNLDKPTEKDIIELLVSIKAKRELSILFVSHDTDLVNRFCDRVIYISDGVIDGSGISPISFQINKNLDKEFDYSETIVELKNIAKSYKTSHSLWRKESLHPVLRDFNLSIKAGQIVGLVGPSGCGKSTLAKIIAGIDDEFNGEYLLNGKNVKDFRKSDKKQMRQDIQIIFQDSFSAMPPHLRVIDLFDHIISTYSLNYNRSKLIDLLIRVGLDEALLDRLPSQLSGGQRQRLLIAKALIVEPKLLICDEIVSSLDDINKASVLNMLMDYVASQGVTLLFISHDTKIVENICDKIYPMNCS